MPDQKEIQRREYVGRINRVIDYIEKNLSKDFTSDELAWVSGFSRFHFHRVFQGVVGETLWGFIRRIRIERSASMLVQQRHESITSIALDCGFSSSAAFSRSFRERFGMSPSEFRDGGYKEFRYVPSFMNDYKKEDSKDCKQDSNQWKDFGDQHHYIDPDNIKSRRSVVSVKVKTFPETKVLYVRHIGAFQGMHTAFERLMNYAGPRGLITPSTLTLAIYHDDPDITPESQLRSDACITVPKDVKATDDIGETIIPEGLYAVDHFEIEEPDFTDAWASIYKNWLPESGYQPDDRPCFELYQMNPDCGCEEGKPTKFIFDIYAPVKPL
jgi:AraC family transcriptional regulator